MNEIKWVKITTDMFDNRKIKAIRKLPEGNNIILIWVMLLSLAGRCNASGMIFLTENIPYTNKMLADELNFDESVICIALDTLEKFGMIARDENLLISVNNWDEYQNVDGMDKIRQQTRKRVSKYRERQRSQALELGQKEHEPKATGFSKNATNVSNLESIMLIYPDAFYFKERPVLYDCVRGWMEYKDEKSPKTSNHYDSEKGIKSLLKKFVECDQEYGTAAVISVVDESILNNYQGITWNRLEATSKNKNVRDKDVFNEWRNA